MDAILRKHVGNPFHAYINDIIILLKKAEPQYTDQIQKINILHQANMKNLNSVN